MTQHPTRRDLLTTAACAATLGLPSSGLAAGGGRALYGSCVKLSALDAEPDYAAEIVKRCQLVVPEGALKWADLRPSRERFDFTDADRLAAFAGRHGMRLRGHTLAWYGAMPDWPEAITSRAEAERELVRHIETVASRYVGLVASWDVVNEAVADRPKDASDLRSFVWTRTLGPDYIPIAFRAAASADPLARLVLNEYDIECADERSVMRRAVLLNLLRSLRDKGVPIHGVGLQGHLHGDRPIDRAGLQNFLVQVRAMGLDVLVTELDVIDDKLPADVATRDAKAAEIARTFLTTIAEVTPPSAVLTWGISDRHTWVPQWFKREDGMPNRPLPLDAAMRPKPLMSVVEQFARASA